MVMLVLIFKETLKSEKDTLLGSLNCKSPELDMDLKKRASCFDLSGWCSSVKHALHSALFYAAVSSLH